MDRMMESWMTPEMVITLKLPNDVNQALCYLSDAYKYVYPNSSGLMNSNHSFTVNSYPITCMVWNVQGACSRKFLSVIKEIIHAHKLIVLALVETHMGCSDAQKLLTCLVIMAILELTHKVTVGVFGLLET